MRVSFTLNGKPVTVETATDRKVRDLLKEMGVRSVRQGCDEEGKCGMCSILLDGKHVNSCLLIAPQLEGRCVETAESLNQGPGLHAIQKAFIEAGVVQCGYCTPAQMLAVKALLDRTAKPTRHQVEDALGGVACRCTGYQQFLNVLDILVEKRTAKDFSPEYRPGYRVVGKLTPKNDAEQLVRCEESYVEDYVSRDALRLFVLRSPHAHAEIVSIDTAEAARMPGVEFILTHENAPRTFYTQAGQSYPEPSPYDQQVMGRQVRFIGDRVAAVAARTREQAEAAAARIKVQYKVLPAVFSLDEAQAPNAPVIHDRDTALDPIPIGGDPRRNLVSSAAGGIGDMQAGLAAADAVVERTMTSGHIQHTPMEPHTSYAYMKNGRLVIHASVQTPFHVRRIVASILGLPENRIRVIKEKVGGGYGAKQDCSVEDLVGTVAFLTGKPVYYRMTRRDEFLNSRTRRPFRITVRAGARRDGRLTALGFRILSDAGAYGPHCLTVPMNACSKTLPLFTCANMSYEMKSFYTNNIVPGAYQGYGVPQGSFILHLALAELAAKIGMSFEDFLRLNLVKSGDRLDILKQLGEGKEGVAQQISSCGLPECLEKALGRLKSWSHGPDAADGDWCRGRGVAVMMQGSGIPGVDAANAILKMLSDGTFMLLIGGADLGTGENTVAAKIAAEVLGVRQEDVTVTAADTDTTPFDKGSYASSGTFFTGSAAWRAAERMKAAILAAAAPLLGIAEPEIALLPGARVGSAARSLSYAELALRTQSGTGCGQLITTGAFTTDRAPIPYAAHACQVAVNRRTGAVKVEKYYAAHDCGVPINPDLARGQVYGAVMKTIGHSLYEQLVFDAKGHCLNPNYTGYPIPTIQDLPAEFDVDLVEVADPITPFVGKSISEIACNGASPCIALGIHEALGIWLYDWPFRPERVLAALESQVEGKANDVKEKNT